MAKLLIQLSGLCAVLMLSACADDSLSDLDDFIKKVKEKPGEKIEVIEEISEGDFFHYELLDDSRDPFVSTKQKVREQVLEAPVVLLKKMTNGIKPDFSRITEDLERFPLGSLQMVGTVKTDQLWGLVRSEEGIQKVKVGNYIGKNHGKIIQISVMEIMLEEIIKEDEALEFWVKKETKLPLDMGLDEKK